MATTEIIDQAVFNKFFDSLGGDPEFLSELVQAYLDSSTGLFASMRQAAATGDAPSLQRAAHSLKTGSANFGALAFAARCKELEDIGRSGALEGVGERIAALESAYAEVAAALQAQRTVPE